MPFLLCSVTSIHLISLDFKSLLKIEKYLKLNLMALFCVSSHKLAVATLKFSEMSN